MSLEKCYFLSVFHSIVFTYISLFTQGLHVLQVMSATSSRSVDSPHHNFIAFVSSPDNVADGSLVRLRYHCSRPCQLGVEVVASTLHQTDLVLFRKTWINRAPQGIRIHQVLLRFPPSILYRRSFYNREVLEAGNVTLRAWLDHFHEGNRSSLHSGPVMISKQLQRTTLSERPTKPPTECPSWASHLMWQINTSRLSQCQRGAGQTFYKRLLKK